MADKKKSAGGKQDKGKRPIIGLWQALGIGLIVLAGCWHFGKRTTEYEGFVQPRQVNARIVDANDSGLAGVVVERQVNASTFGPSQVWHRWAGPTDSNGAVTFAVGGREAGATKESYFWGLYKKEHRDHPVVEYRFAAGGKVVATLREEVFLALPEAGRVDPNHTTFLDPLPDEMLEKTDGKVVVCSMRIHVGGPNVDPNAPKATEPNTP